MSQASPSAKNRTLGKANLPRVLHSGKNSTRGREALPSAAECLALGKERHSAKALFPECNTRGRAALGKEKCYLTAQPAHAVKTKKNCFAECRTLTLGKEAGFPECPVMALVKGPLCRVPGKALREENFKIRIFQKTSDGKTS